MLSDWTMLNEECQLALSREALCRAALIIADQADMLAVEMAAGHLADHGGTDALRLFATVLRVLHDPAKLSPHAAGHA